MKNNTNHKSKTMGFIRRVFLVFSLFLALSSLAVGGLFFHDYSRVVDMKAEAAEKEKELRALKEENMRISVKLTESTSLANIEKLDEGHELVSVDANEIKFIKPDKNKTLSNR